MNLQEELKALKERIAEVEKQIEEEQAFPNMGDEYWYINEGGEVLRDEWGDFGYEKSMLTIGNVYQTENEAEFAVEKSKVEAILRSYSRPFNKYASNYYIELCSYDDSLSVDADADFQPQGTFYFENEEIALEAIDAAGEWHIKRFIFGMEV